MNRLAWIVTLALALSACAASSKNERKAEPLPSHLPNFDELWDYDEPAETEQKFLRLLPQAVASKNSEYHAQLLTQIARTQGLQRDFGAAHSTLDQAESLITESTPTAHVRYLLERGRAFNSSGERQEAADYFRQAWDLAREVEAPIHAVDAAHMLALAIPDSAMEWNLRALDFAESSEDEKARKWLGSLYNNIGWTHHDRGEYDAALEMFQKCFVFRAETKNERGARIAKWCIARTLRSLGRNEEALDMQRELALELEQIGEHDGYVNEELGELLLVLGQSDQATAQFAKAYSLLSQDPNFVSNHGERLARLHQLSLRQ